MTTVRLKLMVERLRDKLILAGVCLGLSIVMQRRIELYWWKLENDVRHMHAILKTRPSR